VLYKRGGVWWVKFKSGGEPVRRSTGTAKKREAEAVERQLKAQATRERKAGRTGLPVERTYWDALKKWIKDGAPESMLSHARNTRPYLDDVKLEDVVPAANEMAADMRKEGLSPQTINRRLSVVRRVLNVAYKKWEWLTEPLGQKIELVSEKGFAREVYLTREEADSLVAAVENAEARKVIVLAAFTGLRRGELLKLQPSNWQEPYIMLTSKTKGKKPRTVPVIEQLWPFMTLPFMVTEHELRVAFEQARDKVEKPHIRFHDLRHTYASWLAKDARVPLTTIRDLLGHSNLSVTSKYAHLRGDTHELVTGVFAETKKGHNEGAQAAKVLAIPADPANITH
jgi:integrase